MPADDRGGHRWDVTLWVPCSHPVLAWPAREGLTPASGSVSIGDTRPPDQGDLPGPPPQHPTQCGTGSHPGGGWASAAPTPSASPRFMVVGSSLVRSPPLQGWILPPSFVAPPHPFPHLSENTGCPHSPRQRWGTCLGAPMVQGQRGAGAHSPTPVPRRKRSTAESRLLLSKPNILAGLWESQEAPPPLPSRGERSETVFS